MILEIPANAKTYELQNAIIWTDESGILYSRPKDSSFVEQTREEVLSEMKKFREITGGDKVCIIVESNNNSKPPKKEDRDFIAEELESVVKAMAVISGSAVSKMIANLFFSFKPPKYPVKLFRNEAEAREWIKNYL